MAAESFLQQTPAVISEVSLQSDPVKRETLPEGLSGCILDIYSQTVYLAAPEHLPKTDTVAPTYYG